MGKENNFIDFNIKTNLNYYCTKDYIYTDYIFKYEIQFKKGETYTLKSEEFLNMFDILETYFEKVSDRRKRLIKNYNIMTNDFKEEDLINIYKIQNKYTLDVIYVGQTKGEISRRFNQHSNDLRNIEKYNYLKENICIVQLCERTHKALANDLEQKYIDFHRPIFNLIGAMTYKKNKLLADEKTALQKCLEIIDNINKSNTKRFVC
jgi:hypothetical protein